MQQEKKKLNHIMVDIETMGTSSFSAIVSIAAVEFDLTTGTTGNTFYTNINLQSCLDSGLVTDPETVKWWSEQSEKAQLMLNEDKAALPEALKMFKKFFNDNDDVQVWGNSARFDLGLLENAFQVCKIDKPWKYYNERCVRTFSEFHPTIKKNTPFTGTPHNAIDDCLHQIKYCSAIWRALYPNKPIN